MIFFPKQLHTISSTIAPTPRSKFQHPICPKWRGDTGARVTANICLAQTHLSPRRTAPRTEQCTARLEQMSPAMQPSEVGSSRSTIVRKNKKSKTRHDTTEADLNNNLLLERPLACRRVPPSSTSGDARNRSQLDRFPPFSFLSTFRHTLRQKLGSRASIKKLLSFVLFPRIHCLLCSLILRKCRPPCSPFRV